MPPLVRREILPPHRVWLITHDENNLVQPLCKVRGTEDDLTRYPRDRLMGADSVEDNLAAISRGEPGW